MTATYNEHRWSRRAKEAEGIHEDDHIYVITRIEEQKFGARTYLTHPNLLWSDQSGPNGASAAANIRYLSDKIVGRGGKVYNFTHEEFSEIMAGDRRPVYGEMFVLLLSEGWGQRAFVLGTTEYRRLLEELDVCACFYETDPEDILIDWEDQAWEDCKSTFLALLPIDARARLATLSQRKQETILWDCYCTAKRQARKEPTPCWDRVIIDVWALGRLFKGAVIKRLLEGD